MITTVDGITEEGLCLLFGRILSGGGLVRGIRSVEGLGSGVRSEENRSGEAASCSYDIIIWYLQGLCPRKLCPSKKRVNVPEIIMSGGFRPWIMFMVISLLIFFQFPT